jgi:hypothetical protein
MSSIQTSHALLVDSILGSFCGITFGTSGDRDPTTHIFGVTFMVFAIGPAFVIVEIKAPNSVLFIIALLSPPVRVVTQGDIVGISMAVANNMISTFHFRKTSTAIQRFVSRARIWIWDFVFHTTLAVPLLHALPTTSIVIGGIASTLQKARS